MKNLAVEARQSFSSSRAASLAALVFLGASAVAACGNRFPGCKFCGHGGTGGSPPDAAADTGAGGACSEPAPVSCPSAAPDYATDIVPIVQQKCLGCHAPGGVEASQPLTSYDEMSARGFTTIQARVRDCVMPPADSPTGPLTSAQRNTLLTWLVCGAPNGSAPDAGTAPETGPTGSGIVPRPENGHCDLPDGGKLRVSIDPSVCNNPPPEEGSGGSDYGETNYGDEADDDDCKYHVKIGLTPVQKDADVTFTVTITDTVTGAPVVGANLEDAEIYIAGTSHIAPASGATSSEGLPGVYTFGPIRFDQSARWTIRFHLFDTYCDAPESPHGHLAFYIDVP